MEHKRIHIAEFRWIFLVDSIVIVGAVMSFGIVAFLGLGMREENALLMVFVIPPMVIATALSTFVTMKSIRKKMDRLLDAIQSVGNGVLEIRLDTVRCRRI